MSAASTSTMSDDDIYGDESEFDSSLLSDPIQVPMWRSYAGGTTSSSSSSAARCSARYWHSAVGFPPNNSKYIVVFGGASARRNDVNVYVFDLATMSWSTVRFETNDVVSSYRWGHTATLMELGTHAPTCKKEYGIWIFGGWDNQCQYNDLHCLALREDDRAEGLVGRWIQFGRNNRPTGTLPNFRSCHSATAVDDKIYIFGGAICVGGPYEMYHDMFAFDTKSLRWAKINAPGGPCARSQHSSFRAGRKIYIFGGWTHGKLLNDLWAFDVDEEKWTEVPTTGEKPPSCTLSETQHFRVHAVARSCAKIESKVYFFGGVGNAPGEHTNHIYVLDLIGMHWTKFDFLSQAPPPTSCNCIAVAGRTNLFVHGGVRRTSDVHLFDVNQLRPFLNERCEMRGDGSVVDPVAAATDIFMANLRQMINNPKFSDIKIKVEGHPSIFAHKSILAARSHWFDAMLSSGMAESTADEIEIPDVPYATIMKILEYIYTGSCDYLDNKPTRELVDVLDSTSTSTRARTTETTTTTMQTDSDSGNDNNENNNSRSRNNNNNNKNMLMQQALSMFVVCCRFALDELRKICEQDIHALLDIHNCVDVLNVADAHQCRSLKKDCIDFALMHFDKLRATQAYQNDLEQSMRDEIAALL